MHKVKLISKKRVTTSKLGPDSTHFHQQLNGSKKKRHAEVGSKLHKYCSIRYFDFHALIIEFEDYYAQFTGS